MLPFLYKKGLKRKYRQEFWKCTFLPAQLEREAKVLQFDVYCKAIDQKFDCGCDRYVVLRLDSLSLCRDGADAQYMQYAKAV